MEIRKIYIENFKGISKKTIVDLDGRQLTILNGPNGFGKTTIFDVIELCLRGRLARAVNYGNITKHNADYQKPFYQNDDGSDVLLKIWLSGSQGQHIIIKRFDKNNDGRISGGRAYRPDAWQLIETYYTDDTEHFEDEPDYGRCTRIDQTFIDNLFFPGEVMSLTNLFPLFHYLQQEENIYFLKKDEEEKKKELDFLFQTQKESEELERAKALARNLNNVKQALGNRISELGQPIGPEQSSPYDQLVSWRSLGWDAREPFFNVASERLNDVFRQYSGDLFRLIEFSRTFDVAEFNKLKVLNQLREVVNSNWQLSSLIIRHFLIDEVFRELESQYDLNRRYKRYREDIGDFLIDSDILVDFNYSLEEIESIVLGFETRKELNAQSSSIGQIVRDLNEARDLTVQKFLELNAHAHSSLEQNCPLCNARWQSLEELNASIANKTSQIAVLMDRQTAALEQQEKYLEVTFIRPFQTKVDKYLAAPGHDIEDAFFAEVRQRRGNLSAVTGILVFFQINKIDITGFQLTTIASYAAISERSEQLRKYLLALISEIVIDESRIQNSTLYTEFFREDPARILKEEDLQQKLTYVTEKFNIAKSMSIQVLSQRMNDVSAALANVEQVRNRLDRTIFEYKKAMIQRIKIPFYIYSGKILQHFQQGYGIFVDVRENTNRIRFLADNSSDHDVIHQLSTGQLAVVSMAFCLSLNKVYKINPRFKFLAIDDPVQTLDDLNIYSLVDLIRHEFSDYQLLISSHDDNVANFLAYKFQKFSIPNEKLNVQSTFYESQNG